LRRYLLKGRHPRHTAELTAAGEVKVTRHLYTNTPADVDAVLYWMGRAAEHDAGLFPEGGRRAQSYKAMTCAGIISHEVGVMMAKHNQEMERG